MHPKILLVDDDSTLLKFLAEFLSEQSYQVITAGNGPEALRLAYHEEPNLAVLDVTPSGFAVRDTPVYKPEFGARHDVVLKDLFARTLRA